MSTWSELLFLHGHITNVDLARSLTATTRSDPPLTAPSVTGEDEAPEPLSTVHGRAAMATTFLVPRFYRELPGEGYAQGFGNRVANERALRPRWQQGPATIAPRQCSTDTVAFATPGACVCG